MRGLVTAIGLLVAGILGVPEVRALELSNCNTGIPTFGAPESIRDICHVDNASAQVQGRNAVRQTRQDRGGIDRSFALLVGIGDYDDDQNFKPLPSPLKDLSRMRDYLLNTAKFDVVITLSNRQATEGKIREAIEAIRREGSSQDRALVYWTGHGDAETRGGAPIGYLPLTTSKHGSPVSTMVRMGAIRGYSEALRNMRHTLFLLDSCASGVAGALAQSSQRDAYLEHLAQTGHDLITAGTSTQKTWSTPQGSFFTTALLDALNGEADKQGQQIAADGIITTDEVVTELKRRLGTEPTQGYKTTPRRFLLNGDHKGQFFFVAPQTVGPQQRVEFIGSGQGMGVSVDSCAAADRDLKAYDSRPSCFAAKAFLRRHKDTGCFAEDVVKAELSSVCAAEAQPAPAPQPMPVERAAPAVAPDPCRDFRGVPPVNAKCVVEGGQALWISTGPSAAEIAAQAELKSLRAERDGLAAKQAKTLASQREETALRAPGALGPRPSGEAGTLYDNCLDGKLSNCTKLGTRYYTGYGVSKQDNKLSVEFYRHACNNGYAEGCNSLGAMHSSGQGVTLDENRAAELYRQGCDGGAASSCVNLGQRYLFGNSVQKNLKLARELLQQGCNGGSQMGCELLKMIP